MGLVVASVQQFDPGGATVVPGTPNIVPKSERAAAAAERLRLPFEWWRRRAPPLAGEVK